MSEKENEMIEEEESVDHWSHEHPLTLVETLRGSRCVGCERRFSSGEQAYGCSEKCGYSQFLHEECSEMARMIRHPLHPQHILILQSFKPFQWSNSCEICEKFIHGEFGYRCTSLGCQIVMHMRCVQGSSVTDAAADYDDDVITHPSHLKHKLRLFGKHSFKCDACGTTRRDNSYICTCCQYWIHQRCASLPQTMKREDHNHSLSLSFHIPLQYLKFRYKCEVCNKYLLPKYWIYHCHLCSFAVHLKCAFTKTNVNVVTEKDMIRLPTNDVAEELIRPFVMRRGGEILAPTPTPHMVNVKYKFLHHQHQLTLISSPSSSSHGHQNQDDEDDGKRLEELICDGCVTPIRSSSSSFMCCSSEYCKYNLHMACFHLPPRLTSLPLHSHQDGHELVLQSPPSKLQFHEWQWCHVCGHSANGLFYVCTKCNYFKVDIKCATMPDTIYHAAHPLHPLKLLSVEDWMRRSYRIICDAGCGTIISLGLCYACDICDFVVQECVMLPASIRSCRWDKHHPLLLMYDANLNHPGDFYCDECETQMNPKSWMFHCRHCDLSFHPQCFPATSGEHRNIKFGQEYVMNAAAPQPHPHPLTFQLLTTKRRCDLCHLYQYQKPGFHCASCNFFICLMDCGQKMLQDGHMQAVD